MSGRRIILGTAGHVDHGKTALIKALTGIETDRLEEEKRRGLSIELGFAHYDLPNGARIGVVDVPGHERFIDTMMSGAHGMDMVLLAVSAKEGVQPQTLEHLQALDLLDIRIGILALTMRDLTTDEEAEFALEEAREALSGTVLSEIPAVAVSAHTGEGMQELKQLIAESAELAMSAPPIDPDGSPALSVDRVFTLEGIGAVVTGTLRGGFLDEGETVVLQPGGLEARVRNIHTHGESVPRAYPGQRTALNLAGVRRSQLFRGQTVTLPNQAGLASHLGVDLRIASDYPRVVERWTRARLHIGAGEAFCRIVPLTPEGGLLPDESGGALLRTERPVFARRGDRYLIRDDSMQHILGGGRILDPSAPVPRRSRKSAPYDLQPLRSDSDENILRHLIARREDPFTAVENLPLYFPKREEPLRRWLEQLETEGKLLRAGAFLIDRARFEELREALLAELRRFHDEHPLSSGMGAAELRNKLGFPVAEAPFEWTLSRLAEEKVLERDRNLARLPGQEIVFDKEAERKRESLEKRLREAGLAAPSETELAAEYGAELLNALAQTGALVKAGDGYWLHRETYEAALDSLRGAFRERGEIDIAGFRELTGASRKYALPFLEHCDRQGWTRRVGNVRKASRRFLEGGSERS